MLSGHSHFDIDTMLTLFRPISLPEIKAAALQKRIDSKYLLNQTQLQEFLQYAMNDFNIVEIENTRRMPYKTLYYDTVDFQNYLRHHNGYLKRTKYRTREYSVTGQVFDEIKQKNNKGVTKKSRIPRDVFSGEVDQTTREFLEKKTAGELPELLPQLWVFYNRITLVDKNCTERLTIDTDLHFEWDEEKFDCGGLVVVEVKRERGLSGSTSENLLRLIKAQKQGFSKYCMGIASTRKTVKANRFKKKIRQIQKLNS